MTQILYKKIFSQGWQSDKCLEKAEGGLRQSWFFFVVTYFEGNTQYIFMYQSHFFFLWKLLKENIQNILLIVGAVGIRKTGQLQGEKGTEQGHTFLCIIVFFQTGSGRVQIYRFTGLLASNKSII